MPDTTSPSGAVPLPRWIPAFAGMTDWLCRPAGKRAPRFFVVTPAKARVHGAARTRLVAEVNGREVRREAAP